MTSHDLTRELASFAVERPVPLSDERLVDRAKRGIADTFGVIVAGAASELGEPLSRFLGSRIDEGGCSVLGLGTRASREVASLVNGAFGHAQDFDDTISMMPGHPSAVIIAALLGDLEMTDAHMGDLLEPYIQGVELAVKLGHGIGLGHYQRGWHATGTVGVYGAVAALARFRGLDVTTTSMAMGIATSMSSGVQRNFGTMTKPLHSGWAAHNAVVAIDLATSGLTAAVDSLDAPRGFFDVYGTRDSSVQTVTETLGSPYVFISPGVSLKKYPCCYALHRVIDGILAIRDRHEVSPETVKAAKVVVPLGVMRPLIYPRPISGLEGKFSMEYVLARGVVDGRFGLDAFTDEAVVAADVQRLLPQVEIIEDASYSPEDPTGKVGSAGSRGFIDVVFEFRDGTAETERVQKPRGAPEKELTWSDVREKVEDCWRSAGIPEGRISKALEMVIDFDRSVAVNSVLSLLNEPHP